MKPFLLSAAISYFSAAVVCNAQSSGSSSQSQSDSSKQSTQPSATSSSAPASPATDQDKEKTKKKPKKVWTNDELSTVSGGISVVGDSSASSSTSTPRKPIQSDSNGGTEKEQRIAAYRDQIQQLRDQIDAADKKINDLRNFKADNTSPTGGLNMNKGYNMVPLEEQIKQLEDQKKKLQAKIDAVEDDARKNGIEAGQLR